MKSPTASDDGDNSTDDLRQVATSLKEGRQKGCFLIVRILIAIAIPIVVALIVWLVVLNR